MTVLVYQRRSKAFNEMVLSEATRRFPEETKATISEYRGFDYQVDANNINFQYDSNTEAYIKSHLSIEDIVFRDRVLRNIPLDEALVLIRVTVGQVLEVLENNKIKACVLYPVDNYVTDILATIVKQFGIPVYGVCNFFMPGYKRSTVFGEANKLRNVPKEEVSSVIQKLKNNFISPMAPNRNLAVQKAIVRYIKYKGRYLIFYLLMHKLLQKKDYDYMATPYNSTVRSFLNFFVERFFTSEKELVFGEKSILIPLHYFPEATVEYWSCDRRQVEFEDMFFCKLDEVVKRYDQVLVKEHPAALFDNSSRFYKKILGYKKVVLVNPFIPTNRLLPKVGSVGCWTGTTAIEALVNDVPVNLFSEGQYFNNCLVTGSSGNVRLDSTLEEFVSRILEGCIPLEEKKC